MPVKFIDVQKVSAWVEIMVKLRMPHSRPKYDYYGC